MPFENPQIAAIRLGYGLSAISAPPGTAQELLAGLKQSMATPDGVTTEQARARTLRLNDLRRASKSGAAAKKAFQQFNKECGQLQVRDLQRRLARAVDHPTGFGERLVQFWSGHFTIRPPGAGHHALAMAFTDEAIRPHINGRFEDLFFAADTHPMMLLYLNQNTSRGPNSAAARRGSRKGKVLGLNENLAREAMELHSMGVGAPYTQKDVRELAELLTGLDYSLDRGFAFRPQNAEPGPETVLGNSYGGGGVAELRDIRAALRDIARRPETAQFVSHKLAVHFVSDNPPADLVEAMAATWRDTKGDLAQVYRVLVTHPALADTLRHKVRQPYDLLIAGFRAMGITGAQILALEHPLNARMTFDSMAGMGQPWMRQNGPDGWPENAEAWIAPQLLAARINWSLRMPRFMVPDLPDPRELMQTAFRGSESQQLAWAVPKAESAAEGVALILASSDFNRR